MNLRSFCTRYRDWTDLRAGEGSLRRAVAAMFLLAHSVIAFGDDWPMYGHDPSHTSYANVTTDPTKLQLAWTSPTGYYEPIIHGNTLYAAGSTGVTAFNLANGHVLWSTPLAVSGGLSYMNGALVCCDFSFNTSASIDVLDPTTGAMRYAVPLDSKTDYPGNPVVYQNGSGQLNSIVQAGHELYSFALGPSSGSISWRSTCPVPSLEAPTIVGNSVIFADTGEGNAVDLATGQVNTFFSSNLSGGGAHGIAYDSSRKQLYFCLESIQNQVFSTNLYAYHYTDNNHLSLVWSHAQAEATDPSIAPDGSVYISDGSKLYQLSPTNGNVIWSTSFAGNIYEAPLVINGYVFDDTSSSHLAFGVNPLSVTAVIPTGPDFVNDSRDAISDGFYVAQTNSQFSVYSVPEPSGGLIVCVAGAILAGRDKRKKLGL